MNSKRRSSLAEREIERVKKRQEVYMDAMSDLEMLRDHYKSVLRSKFEEKVKKQRAEREKNKNASREFKKEGNSKVFSKINLPKSHGNEDTDFLKKIPVSKFYNIIKIKEQMEKKNELDKKYKVEEFHKLVSKKGMAQKLEREIRRGNVVTFSRLRDMARSTKERPEEFPKRHSSNVLSPIPDEDLESGKRSVVTKKERSGSGNKKRDTKGDTQSSNLEDLFPTVNYPKLPMINRNLESPEPEPEEIKRALYLEKKRNSTEKRKYQIARMFKQSVANKAATSRLMNKYKHLDFNSLAENNEMKKITINEESKNLKRDFMQEAKQPSPANHFSTDQPISSNHKVEDYLTSLANMRITTNNHLPILEERDEFEDESEVDMERTSRNMWKTRAYSDASLRNQILGRTRRKSEPIQMSPLTMGALEESTRVKIVRGPSMVWVNPV